MEGGTSLCGTFEKKERRRGHTARCGANNNLAFFSLPLLSFLPFSKKTASMAAAEQRGAREKKRDRAPRAEKNKKEEEKGTTAVENAAKGAVDGQSEGQTTPDAHQGAAAALQGEAEGAEATGGEERDEGEEQREEEANEEGREDGEEREQQSEEQTAAEPNEANAREETADNTNDEAEAAAEAEAEAEADEEEGEKEEVPLSSSEAVGRRDGIRVVVRIRPPLPSEEKEDGAAKKAKARREAVKAVDDGQTLAVQADPMGVSDPRSFTFHKVRVCVCVCVCVFLHGIAADMKGDVKEKQKKREREKSTGSRGRCLPRHLTLSTKTERKRKTQNNRESTIDDRLGQRAHFGGRLLTRGGGRGHTSERPLFVWSQTRLLPSSFLFYPCFCLRYRTPMITALISPLPSLLAPSRSRARAARSPPFSRAAA